MADDLHYSSKRKFDDPDDGLPPASRRATGFSAPIASPPSAGSQPHLELAKQKAQEIAARLFITAQAQAKSENGDNPPYSNDYPQKPLGQPIQSQYGVNVPSYNSSYGSQSSTKKIEILNSRVGVIIGKSGETIKYLQAQSGAKIQVTRDADVIPFSQTRHVDIVGTLEQVNRAEQLINDVLAEADAGASGIRKAGSTQYGGDQFSMKVPSNKVGLVIGKGGETIKNMQATSGARIQVIPLHPPPGDTSLERTVQIDGTPEQIETAKQLVNDVISGQNRLRNQSMSAGGGYSQQTYQPPPQQPMWGPPGGPPHQPPPQQQQQQQPAPPVSYYPQYGGYLSYPDQSTNQTPQQPGYDYYNAPQQPANPSADPADANNTYNYSSYPDSSAYPQHAYPYPPQDGSANSAPPAYPYPPQDGSANSAPPAATQAPPPSQQGYNGQPGYAAYYSQPGYGYGAPPLPTSGYGPGPAHGGVPVQGQTGYSAGYAQGAGGYGTESAPSAAPPAGAKDAPLS